MSGFLCGFYGGTLHTPCTNKEQNCLLAKSSFNYSHQICWRSLDYLSDLSQLALRNHDQKTNNNGEYAWIQKLVGSAQV